MIGDVPSWRVDHMPYGGVKDSGLGREGDPLRDRGHDRDPPARGAHAAAGEMTTSLDRSASERGDSVREVLARERAGGSVTVRGWLRTTRHSKGLSFLELSDGSCFAGLQVVAEPALAELRERGARARHRLRGVDHGRGRRFAGPGPALRAARDARRAGGRRRAPTTRSRRSATRSSSCARSRTCGRARTRSARCCACATPRPQAIHQFFQERGFLCLQTPVITASDAEGAGELFRVTTLDPAQPAARRRRRASTGARTSSGARRSSPCRASSRPRSARSRVDERLHVRADVPRRELEHEPPPRRVLDDRARDGVLRSRGQHGRSPRRS